jgi:hypothetical protein
MPPRKSLTRRLLHHLFLVSLANGILAVLGRRSAWDEWDGARRLKLDDEPEAQPTPSARPVAKRGTTRRLATSLSFCVLFFAGLALSAGAGDHMRSVLAADETTPAATPADTSAGATTDASATGAPATPAAPAVDTVRTAIAQPAPQVTPVAASSPVKTAVAKSGPTERFDRPAPAAAAKQAATSPHVARATPRRAPAHRPRKHQLNRHVKTRPAQPLDGEASLPGATVWLHQAAPDPTPPAARLRLRFARELVAYSRQAHVDWALVLAVLRADGREGRVPATRAGLRGLSLRLAAYGGRANPWASALGYSSNTGFADRVVALRHYYRAVGLASLVRGLVSQKKDLQDRVLHDARLQIYPGGRSDVASGRVDVRVLATMLYLANTFHQVTVSCLISGHRLYARPGVISAHIYGRAVDIAALGGTSIYGNQQQGGVTEQGVRSLLMLPGGMLPAQIISLIGLGGPSFPLANHYDHIHVGY